MSEEFFNAATQGDVAKVKAMLNADPSLARAKDANGLSVILKATYYGKKDVTPTDILVKGADWPADQIVGRDTVEARGGRVVRIAVEPGYSTTAILGKIRDGGL